MTILTLEPMGHLVSPKARVFRAARFAQTLWRCTVKINIDIHSLIQKCELLEPEEQGPHGAQCRRGTFGNDGRGSGSQLLPWLVGRWPALQRKGMTMETKDLEGNRSRQLKKTH